MSLNFDDLTPIEEEFSWQGKDYVVREASAGACATYKSANFAASRMVDGKLARFEGLADSEPLLVSLCVFHVTKAPNCNCGNGVGCKRHPAVTLPIVRDWPSSLVKRLFDHIKEISPALEDKNAETIEDLEKRMAKDTAALTKLRAEANGDNEADVEAEEDDPAKNLPESTVATSA